MTIPATAENWARRKEYLDRIHKSKILELKEALINRSIRKEKKQRADSPKAKGENPGVIFAREQERLKRGEKP